MHDQLGQTYIKCTVAERQPLGRCHPDIHPPEPLGHRRGERLRRVHRGDRILAQATDQLRGQRPGPAANIEGPLPAVEAGQVGEQAAERLRITPHEPRVSIRAHVKEHATKPTRHRPHQPQNYPSVADVPERQGARR